MSVAPTMMRPHRWDVPFDSDMTDADVEALMSIPAIANVQASAFPAHIPLRGILHNDTRIVSYQTGDIVCREGDYGSSAFLILSGAVRVVLSPSLPRNVLGHRIVRTQRRRHHKPHLALLQHMRQSPESDERRAAGRPL